MAFVRVTDELTGHILDLGGGGEGVIGRVYGARVTAIDTRQSELDEAPDGPEKLVMDACALRFANASFDAVTAFYFFMYLPTADHDTALREAYRALKPGGHLVIWDAEIEQADPFLVELHIDANGAPVHTTYGVHKPDAAQSADSLHAHVIAASFEITDCAPHDGQFYIGARKPAQYDGFLPGT